MDTKRLRSVNGEIGDTEEEIQDIYKEVLMGTRLVFPKYFWSEKETVNLYHAKVVTKYLVEDILKWNRDEVNKNFSSDLLRQYKLAGMLLWVFVNSPMAVLENAHPGKYDPKEMQATSMRHDDNILQKEALRFHKLCKGFSHEEIVKLYDNAFCVKNRFTVITQSKEVDISKFSYWRSHFQVDFMNGNFSVPKGFWAMKKNRKRATLWLIEKEGTKALTVRQFSENGLSRILHYGKGLNNTICEALGILQEQNSENFYTLLCQCHNNGIDLIAEFGINSKVLHSWTTRIKCPPLPFLL